MLGNSLPADQVTSISVSAEKVDLDYLNMKLTLTLRQDAISTSLHEAIIKLLRAKDQIVLQIDNFDGEDQVNYMLEFTCKGTSHKFTFDYAQTDPVAKHIIEFDIQDFLPYNKSTTDDIKETETNLSRMEG